MVSRRALFVFLLTGFSVGCATHTVEPYVHPAPQYALPAAADGAFAQQEAAIRAEHGPDVSGFRLLDTNADGLRWRLALIDSAKHSIDVQYYLWQGDDGGRIMTKRLLDAADRGVRVRMLVDDINTLLGEGGKLTVRDKVAAWVDAHRNLEVRLFNPWSNRDLGGRAGEAVSDLTRINQRMHNKVMIVDNQATVIGGRNVGDPYFGLSPAYNFHDLDVLGIGPVAREASKVFDSFWNSEWVMPVAALHIAVTPAEQAAARTELVKRVEQAESLVEFPSTRQSWSNELTGMQSGLHFGTFRVVSDVPETDDIRHVMLEEIHSMLASAQHQLLIINAYIIPAERGIEALRSLHDRGVDMKILTNSLASHDVPAVNAHYKQWRRPILEAGAQLYEIRHDTAVQPIVSDTPPTHAEFMGLHAKGMVIDRQRVFIGSMNYDPRSAQINTEMGVFINSPSLAEALAKQIERDIKPANSWQVSLDAEGELRWVHDQEVVNRQPARSWWQRVEDVIFMAFPKEIY